MIILDVVVLRFFFVDTFSFLAQEVTTTIGKYVIDVIIIISDFSMFKFINISSMRFLF